jgi:phage terminase small subunit
VSKDSPRKPLKLTVKQRAFVAYRIAHPTATDTECALSAGYSPSNTAMGHEVANHPAVVQAVQAAQALTMAQAGLSRESHLNTLERLRDQAAADGQFSAAISAEVHRGKVGGFYEERVRLLTSAINKMTPAELDAAAEALGIE